MASAIRRLWSTPALEHLSSAVGSVEGSSLTVAPAAKTIQRSRSLDVSPSSGRPFLILSLDGGGARGIVMARLLARLKAVRPSFLDRVDLIAGTSTGAMMALMLAAEYTPTEVEDIYRHWLPPIFQSRRSFWGLERAKYDDATRLEACERYMGKDTTMDDLSKLVLVPAFKLSGKKTCSFFPNQSWSPSLFTNMPSSERVGPDLDRRLVDVSMASSAAPTVFAVHKGYVDGALVGNNPALVTVGRCFESFPRMRRREVAVCSLGTGHFPYNIADAGDWGLRQWAPYLLEAFLAAQATSTDLSLKMLLGDRYCRLDPELSRQIALDDVGAIEELLDIADETDLDPLVAWFDDL